MDWKQVIENWRKLPEDERRCRWLEAIPRHVALSMAVAGEPVSEDLIRAQLEARLGLTTRSGLSDPQSED